MPNRGIGVTVYDFGGTREGWIHNHMKEHALVGRSWATNLVAKDFTSMGHIIVEEVSLLLYFTRFVESSVGCVWISGDTKVPS